VSLKPTSVTSLPDGTATRNSRTACFSFGIAGPMLPLISRAAMSSSGTFALAKYEMGCACPFS
jgi:hypothetical protein